MRFNFIRVILLGLSCFFVSISTAETVSSDPVSSLFDVDHKEIRSIPSKFLEPQDSRNYAHYRYVGAHNAHVYAPFYEAVKQQDADIVTQLAHGVRGLMLDTYNWTLSWPYVRMGEGSVVLSHGKPGDILVTAQKVSRTYQTLKWELKRIFGWMKVNPLAVVTIILEDYADSATTVKEIKEVIQETGYDPIFKQADWKPMTSHLAYEWPTLGWMRQFNKRLVIFTQRVATTDVTWNQFSYCAENKYSTTNKDELWKERAESAARSHLPRQLVIFNNFPADPFTSLPCISKEQMKYTTAKDVISFCKAKGFAHGRIFNGYFVDRVLADEHLLISERKPTVFDYVNELNYREDPTLP